MNQILGHGLPVAPSVFVWYKTDGTELVFQSFFLLGPSLLLVSGTGCRSVNVYLNVALQLISKEIRRCFERWSAITKGKLNWQCRFFCWAWVPTNFNLFVIFAMWFFKLYFGGMLGLFIERSCSFHNSVHLPRLYFAAAFLEMHKFWMCCMFSIPLCPPLFPKKNPVLSCYCKKRKWNGDFYYCSKK